MELNRRMRSQCLQLVVVKEIRSKSVDGIYRTVYVAKFEEAIYVLHAFKKKTQKTPKSDLDLAKVRLKDLIRRR